MDINQGEAHALKLFFESSVWNHKPGDAIQEFIGTAGVLDTQLFVANSQKLIEAANKVLPVHQHIALNMASVFEQALADIDMSNVTDLLTTAHGDGTAMSVDNYEDMRDVRTTRNTEGDTISVTFEYNHDGKTWQRAVVNVSTLLHTCAKIKNGAIHAPDDVYRSVLTMFTDEFDYDVNTADYIFQMAAFGCIVYC